MDFVGRVVLITGAGSGIGAATARAFAKQSSKLSLLDVNASDLDKTVKECVTIGSEVLKIVVDLSNDEALKLSVEDTLKKFGKLDVVVNCAGIYMPGGILDSKLMETFDRIIGVNLRAVVALINFAASALIETKGSVVNICSVNATLTTKGNVAYHISKAGLMHFTRCAALELADKGVRVNSISPGGVKTNIYQYSGMTSSEIEASESYCIDKTPMKRFILPEEVAELVLYLSSDKAKNITGSDYGIDGGLLLSGLGGD